jgi:Transglycosylase SLT domain
MQHRVHVAVAYAGGTVGLILVLVAAALATAHTSVGEAQPIVFQPVTVPAPRSTPSAPVVPDLIYDSTFELTPRARPTVPAIGVQVQASIKPKPKPKPVAKPAVVRSAPKPVVKRTAVPSVADARAYALSRIGSTQFSCLDRLFTRESGWNPYARNASTGAYGIPQALPGDKMATIASDWRTNPVTQVRWGLSYISGRYGTACNAWAHSQNYGWY